MNGEQSGLRARQQAPQEQLTLALDAERVLHRHGRHPVRAEFRFDPAAPLIVSATFTPARGAGVTWRIGRELLYQGLYEESGEGDIQIWPVQEADADVAWLRLESKASSAILELPVPAMAAWLEATYALVSAEDETDTLDWDGFMADLLGAPGAQSG